MIIYVSKNYIIFFNDKNIIYLKDYLNVMPNP